MREVLARAIARLEAGGVADEAIAAYKAPPRFRLFTREPVLVQVDRGWRLGVLLLTRDGRLFAVGEVTRAVEPKWPSNRSAEVERRRQHQAAAARGRFSEGEIVNFNVEEISIDAIGQGGSSGPLSMRDGELVIRWAPGGPDTGLMPFDRYLADRLSLLPPLGP